MSNLQVVCFFIITTAFSCSNIVGAAEIESSFPPNNAIDARSPFVGSAAELQGWQSIEIRFSAAISGLDPEDFTLSEKGGDGIPPSIDSVARIDSKTVLVILNEPLEPGTWIDLSHLSSGTSISLGYLPGDVNGDGTVSPYADTLALIDCLNIPDRCAPWQQDLDRSGRAQWESDRQMLFGLLRGTVGNTAWAGVRMPQEVLPILTAARLANRDPLPGTARGTDEIHIRLDVTDLGPTEFGSVSVFDPAAFTPMLGVPVDPNDQLLLHIWARNNTAIDILLRGIQFDPQASSFPYSLFGIDIDTGNQPLDGVPNCWFDYSELEPLGELAPGLFPAAGPSSTGIYVDFSNTLHGLPLVPFPQATIFVAFAGGPFVQIPMPPSQWVHLGAIPITVPTGSSSYTIDPLNVPNNDLNYGARIDFGFGGGPGDPVTTFSSAPGADGSIAYAPSGECGGSILYDGALQQFRPSFGCCGNGVVEPGETCDDGGESATCDADCTIAECGDGTLNGTAGEVCDDGLNNSDTEPDACRTDCSRARCGDGVVDAGENCDDGNTDPDDGCDCLFGLGACCLGTACSVVTESECLDSGGFYFGLDTTCDAPDFDGDGLRDECDGCRFDPNKIEPGACGCGEDDTPDSDGDGVPDCVDTCQGANDAFLSHCEPPLFKLWVTEVYEVNPDGSYTPKCGASCPTQDLPGGLAEPGDLINIEVTVEGWDADIDLGQCNSDGEECSVSAQDCANSHCSGSQTSGECNQNSDCFLPDTCDPDRCEKTPKLGAFQWTIDSSTYSNGGPGPGFAPAELACTTDEDCACAYTEIPGNSNDCADFAALAPDSCTCTQAACNTSVCGPRAAAYMDSSPVSNFVFFNHNALLAVDVSSLDYTWAGLSFEGNEGGIPEDLSRCNAGAQPICNVDADCTAGTCELVATAPFYLGTLLLEATGESCGLFTLDLRQEVVQGGAVWTFLDADTAVKFPTPIVEPLTIEIGGQAGDCNGNGIPDECDEPVCGDGCIMGTEECDDGNTNSGDGCDANCMIQGACCLGFACNIVTESECLDFGGTFFGPNSTCDAPDADGDGLRNECDGCPNDASKIEPGACGCGVDDAADSDDDGVPDCKDLCPGADDAVFGDCNGAIPTVSVWGLMILTLLLLAGSKVVFRDRLRRYPAP